MELQLFFFFLKITLKLSYFIMFIKKKKKPNHKQTKNAPQQTKIKEGTEELKQVNKEAYNEKNQERDS